MSHLGGLLKKHGLWLNKRLGQHLLVDERVCAAIADALDVCSGDRVVEIGPGAGRLTLPVLQRAGRLWAIEKDIRFQPLLMERIAGAGELTLIEADALRFDFSGLAAQLGGPLRIVANLPYNIGTPLLFHLLDHREVLIDLTLMFQKEVAQRLTAEPGSKVYGALSVMCQLWTKTHRVLDVAPGAFLPPPKVASRVVRIIPRLEPAVPVTDEALFRRVVQAAFGQRRKTLRNALRVLGADSEAWLEAAGIDPGRRGETLTLMEFSRLVTAQSTWPQ
jgi:16S rRNA (adenine1518-N6/adenine1519-N6)-dimethyltransferase